MRKTAKVQPPDVLPTRKTDYKAVIRRTIASIVDNLNVDARLLNELKSRRLINDQILMDVLSRTNRPQKVLRLAEHLLKLGPHALKQAGDAMAKYGYPALADILKNEL